MTVQTQHFTAGEATERQARPVPVAEPGAGPARAAGVVVRGLGAGTRRGWVFRDVDLDIAPGELVALTGPAASGRTSLLLALAGYFKTTHGSVVVDGRAALAYVPRVHEPEGALTVGEHLEERRRLLAGGPELRARARRLLTEYELPANRLGRDLDALGSHLLCLALARLNDPGVIVVDDADVALSGGELVRLWTALRDTGVTVVAACREIAPELVDRTVTLEASG